MAEDGARAHWHEREWLQWGGAAGALLTSAAVAERASARAATYCVKASKVKPPKPAAAHFTGRYNDKICSEPNASHEGKYELLAELSFEQGETLRLEKEQLEIHISILDNTLGDACTYLEFEYEQAHEHGGLFLPGFEAWIRDCKRPF